MEHQPFKTPADATEYWINSINNIVESPLFERFKLSYNQVDETVRKVLDADDLADNWEQQLGSLLFANPNTISKMRVARAVYDFVGDEEPDETHKEEQPDNLQDDGKEIDDSEREVIGDKT